MAPEPEVLDNVQRRVLWLATAIVLREGDDAILDRLFAVPQPLVTLLEGHPHSLAFLAGVHGGPVASPGVTEFGQSGDIAELYAYHGVDAETVIGAVLDQLG